MERKLYNRTYWVNHETPVNADNLNKIETALYELFETTLRPSDILVKEDGGLKLTSNCGMIFLEVDESVLRGSDSLKKFNVITNEIDIDPTIQNSLDYLVNEESGIFEFIYNGKKYSQEINIKNISNSDGKSLEQYIKESTDQTKEDCLQSLKKSEEDLIKSLEDTNFILNKKIEELTRKLNTLSTRYEMLNDKINQMEDKNNGLETM